MKQADRDKAERVRSAKVWLDKAEESFRSSSDVQGELSLLLAEAEMKNLRKTTAQERISCVTEPWRRLLLSLCFGWP